ncbi:type II toxin-antitoxin system HicB family antitoxin [Otoolea muris]|uniref:type II toxin-antitoxin system HicB family antitoxin n=1 Tax=Otoolea muris TaxID=2941515 RepID=UPI002041E9B5|nr:type II toxin-antitoxin system HicB family antitoxin [Otoolea muris]
MSEYSVFIQYDPVDEIFVVSIPELPGCMAHGETKEKALKEIETAKELWIETALEDGQTIPEPSLFNSMMV